MVDPDHDSLSVLKQCVLLGLNRSSLYYQPRPVNEEDLALMRLIDEQFLETPFYGTRRMTVHLQQAG